MNTKCIDVKHACVENIELFPCRRTFMDKSYRYFHIDVLHAMFSVNLDPHQFDVINLCRRKWKSL